MVDGDSGGAAVPFPVVFFDGERESNIGYVKIYPSLQFKSFQSVVSQKIGISPNQISIYLADRKRSKSVPDDRRRMPITGKSNFSMIVGEKNSYILVVLKRSRRERRRKPKQNAIELGDYLLENKWSPLPEKFFLLRRNQPDLVNSQVSGYISPYYNQNQPSEFVDYIENLRNLQAQRQNALMTDSKSNFNLDPNSNLYGQDFPAIEDDHMASSDPIVCEVCTDAKMEGKTAAFHWCIHDVVATGFRRSPAGPIARPAKVSA